MESVLAIGVGLVLRVVVDVATDNDDRVGGVLVGLWEGVVLNHFVRKTPRSFDPYIGLGFRIFVDFLFTQSLSRLALVALWTVVGMLLADVAPTIWYDSGLRRIYRQVRKDVRHIKRAVPDIRIKNDIPSVRFFTPTRATSTVVSGSIRSDRAAPARSPAPAPAPMPEPPRMPGRSPPGTFPGVSGWSEVDTDVTALRGRVVMGSAPSPALIPSREDMGFGVVDTTHVPASRARTTSLTESITITQTQKETVLLETVVGAAALGATTSTLIDLIDDPSRHDPPMIPDDWVNVTPPMHAQPDAHVHVSEPSPPYEPRPDSTTLDARPRPASIVVPTPGLSVLPNIPDIDLGEADRSSRVPHRIPLPQSRAASVIGGVYDQPQPRIAWRENVLSHVDKASSDIGIDPSRPFAPFVATHSKASSGSHTRAGSTGWAGSRLRHTGDDEAPEVTLKADETKAKAVVRGEAESVSGRTNKDDAIQEPEPQLHTPAQVDPPASILNQPMDVPPTSTAADPKRPAETTTQPDIAHVDGTKVDASLVPPQTGTDKGAVLGPSRNSFLDANPPICTPPPLFTEFAGVGEVSAGEGPTNKEPVMQDEQPTELTEEQKAAEAKRQAFLMKYLTELEDIRERLQGELEAPKGKTPKRNTVKSKLEDTEKSLSGVKTRMSKKAFSEPPANPSIPEISVVGKPEDIQSTLQRGILDALLARDDAGPLIVQVDIKGKNPNKKARDAVTTFAEQNQFSWQSESPNINIAF